MNSAEAPDPEHDKDQGARGGCERLDESPRAKVQRPAATEPTRSPWQFSIRYMMAIIASFAATFGIINLVREAQDRPPPMPSPALLTRLLGTMDVPQPASPTPTTADVSVESDEESEAAW